MAEPLDGVSVARTAGQTAMRIARNVGWRGSTEPDVVLLAARGTLHLVGAGLLEGTDVSRAQLEHLVDLAIPTPEGHLGWGLSYAWDAFGNGTTNPASTVYSYTTAAAGLALLDAHAVLGDQRWLELAASAAMALLTSTCCWRSGDLLSVWYSDQPADQLPEYQTHNVNALALAVLSRLDRALPTPRFADHRRAMARHLVQEQGRDLGARPAKEGTATVAPSNWRYRQGDPRPNDLMHECFIVEGLLEAGFPDCRRAALRSLKGIWHTHFSGSGQIAAGPYTWGSLGWGPAGGLFALSSSSAFRGEADVLAAHLAEMTDDAGLPAGAPLTHDRAGAWYCLALARYCAGVAGAATLLPPDRPASTERVG